MIAPNETCATAGTPITTATTLTMQNLAGAVNDYTWTAGRCAAPGTGSPDLVYAVTAPSGNRLTATVTGIFNAVINVVDGTVCANGATQACLAGANLQTGGTEVVTFDNTNCEEPGAATAPGVRLTPTTCSDPGSRASRVSGSICVRALVTV